MTEELVRGETLTEAYHLALLWLNDYGEITNCPDYNTRQKELSLTMVVENPLKEPRISKLFPGGPDELEQYRQEILDGILDFEIDRGNWAYTYHSRMAEQIPFIINELKRNSDSRRAVIQVRDWHHDAGNDNPACLQLVQYFIRNNKLHCKVLFRSNDAVQATFMNAFALIALQEKIANELGVEVGSYTHRANSFHAYEKNWPELSKYADAIADVMARGEEDKITYNYEGEWDELMEDAKPMIAAKVEELKNRPVKK